MHPISAAEINGASNSTWTCREIAFPPPAEGLEVALQGDGFARSADLDEEGPEEPRSPLFGSLMQWIWNDDGQESDDEKPRAQPRRPQAVRRMSRLQLANEAFVVMQDVIAGRQRPEALEILAGLAAQPLGGEGVADAVEFIVVAPDGPQRLSVLLHKSSVSPVAARALAATWGEMAVAAATRTVGLLLLITDGVGGKAAVAAMLRAASADAQAAIDISTLLEAGSSNPQAARGAVELLDTMTRPDEDGGREACEAVAAVLAQAARRVGGLPRVARGLANLQETEGGARAVADMMRRFCATRMGRVAVRQMLLGLSRHDADATTRLLARACASQNGARSIVDTLNRLAASDKGRWGVGRLVDRLGSSRVAANFFNAARRNAGSAFDSLLERLSA